MRISSKINANYWVSSLTHSSAFKLAWVSILTLFAGISIVNAETLSWNAPQNSEDGSALEDLFAFNVAQSTSADFSVAKITRVSGKETQLTISNLTAGVSYYFRVTAIDSNGNESPASSSFIYTAADPGSGAIPKNPPTPNPDPTPSPGPRVSPADQVYSDFNGDGWTDILRIETGTYQVQLSTSDGIAIGEEHVGSLASDIIAAGPGSMDSNSPSSLISVSRPAKTGVTNGKLLWSSTNPLSGEVTFIGEAGALKDFPVIGCQSKGKIVPVSVHRAKEKTSIYLNGSSRSNLNYPKVLSKILCTYEGVNDSKILAISQNKTFSLFTLGGRKLLSEVALPSLPGTQLVVIPGKAATQSQIAGISIKSGKVVISVLDKKTKRWKMLATGTKLKKFDIIWSGNDAGGRWIGVASGQTNYFYSLSSELKLTSITNKELGG